MKQTMNIDPLNNKRLYKQVKRRSADTKVLPKDNWKIGEKLNYRFLNGNEMLMTVVKINGYNTLTGELHLTLVDDKGIGLNSAYDKERFKI